jgi:hypothetical protein
LTLVISHVTILKLFQHDHKVLREVPLMKCEKRKGLKPSLSMGVGKSIFSVGLVLAGTCLFTARASAALIAYEPFNYPVGSTLVGGAGGTGFSGPWATPRPGGGGGTPANSNTIGAGSLAGPAGLTTIGNHALFTGEPGTMDGLHRPFANVAGTDGTTTWVSLIAQRQGTAQDPPVVGTNPYPRGANVSFYDSQGTTDNSGVADERFGIGNSSNANDNEWSIVPEGSGTLREGPASHLPAWSTLAWGVLRIDHVGDHTVGDSAWLWINPNPLGGEPLKANADVTILSGDTNSRDFSNVDFIRPFVGNVQGTVGNTNFRPFAVMRVDEIRIGTTWADMRAIPEPSTLILLILSAPGLNGRRRTV